MSMDMSYDREVRDSSDSVAPLADRTPPSRECIAGPAYQIRREPLVHTIAHDSDVGLATMAPESSITTRGLVEAINVPESNRVAGAKPRIECSQLREQIGGGRRIERHNVSSTEFIRPTSRKMGQDRDTLDPIFGHIGDDRRVRKLLPVCNDQSRQGLLLASPVIFNVHIIRKGSCWVPGC